nr:MAG TPA: hypothetical protein [Caudoviricetes sp.]
MLLILCSAFRILGILLYLRVGFLRIVVLPIRVPLRLSVGTMRVPIVVLLLRALTLGGATGDSGPYLQLEVNCARNLYFRLGSDGRVYMVDATAFESRQKALAEEMSRSWSNASPNSYL